MVTRRECDVDLVAQLLIAQPAQLAMGLDYELFHPFVSPNQFRLTRQGKRRHFGSIWVQTWVQIIHVTSSAIDLTHEFRSLLPIRQFGAHRFGQSRSSEAAHHGVAAKLAARRPGARG